MTEATETETAVEAIAEETVETADVTPEVTEVATPREPVIIDRPIQTVGRRKEAVVRVRLVPGTGKFHLDGRTLEDYFPNKVHQQIVREPLTILELDGAYDVLVRVHGGGPSGQAGAVRLGVARSLNGVDEELNRPALKKAGFLTRDPRMKERKKYGLKAARRAPQFSKR